MPVHVSGILMMACKWVRHVQSAHRKATWLKGKFASQLGKRTAATCLETTGGISRSLYAPAPEAKCHSLSVRPY